MKPDPTEQVVTRQHKFPPSRGPGSGKAAWVAEAMSLQAANESLAEVIEGQAGLIRELQAEVELLRRQIAERKPRGGRARVDDDRVSRIERALEQGGRVRHVAKAFGVSPMTVSRIAARKRARDAL